MNDQTPITMKHVAIGLVAVVLAVLFAVAIGKMLVSIELGYQQQLIQQSVYHYSG